MTVFSNAATLPESVRTHAKGKGKPLSDAFLSIWLENIAEADKILSDFESIRSAKSKVSEVLEKGTTPEAIKYRELSVKATTKIEAIKADEKYEEKRATIKRLQEEIAADISERTSKIREVVKEAKDNAVKAEIGEVVSDVNPEELAKRLTDANTTITAGKNMLQAEHEGLKGWRPISVTAAQGGNSSSGDVWKPRISLGRVNGNDVPASNGKNVTMTDVAKAAGINDVHNLSKALLSAVGGLREGLRTDGEPHAFVVEVNDKPVNVEILGRASGKAEAAPVETPEPVSV